MSCSSRPQKTWRSLISALLKKLTNAKNSKPFHANSAKYSSFCSCHRHFRYQIIPEHPLITGVDFRVRSDDAYAVSPGENRGAEEEDDDEDDSGAIVVNEVVKLHGNVDANAEEFIKKMRAYWKLERQISDENYKEMVAPFYEH